MNPIVMPVRSHIPMTQRAIVSALGQHIAGGVLLNVIDNGSVDGSGAYLRSLDHIVLTTYARHTNLHRVWNRALSFAFHTLGAAHVLVINNDIVMRPDTYSLLVADGGEFVTGIAVDTEEATRNANPSARTPHPCFSCFLIRRTCWERVGPFEESYYIYAGDCAMHVRMHRMGIEARQIDVPFLHVGSGTLKVSDLETRTQIQRLADIDREIFRQHHGCEIGTPEYDSLFDPSTFGVDAQ